MARAKAVENPSAALGYLRTSSAANAGADKDSEARQRLAIERYAAAARIEIVAWYYDAAVSGADPVEIRPGTELTRQTVTETSERAIVEAACLLPRCCNIGREATWATLVRFSCLAPAILDQSHEVGQRCFCRLKMFAVVKHEVIRNLIGRQAPCVQALNSLAAPVEKSPFGRCYFLRIGKMLLV